MASDEIVWQIINQQFCSFKLSPPSQPTKTPTARTTINTFCRNTDNVTGLCTRQSCPLANSRYATIRASPATGVLYLCTKTIERAHTPNKLWSRLKLSQNYTQALAQIDAQLAFWPKFLVHKCKQRLTRLTQVAIRTRRLAREEERLGERVVGVLGPKVRRREATRERKAEAAARVERAIERELVERLRRGEYGDRPLNVEEGVWRRVLRGLERGGEGERDVDLDEGVEEEEWEVEGEGGQVEYVSDDEEEEELESVGDLEEWLGGGSGEGEEDGSDDDDDDAEEENEDGGSGEEDFTTEKKKADAGAKRKRGADKKAPRKTRPKMEIEYEVAAPEREAVIA